MHKRLLLSSVVIFSSICTFGQDRKDSLSSKKNVETEIDGKVFIKVDQEASFPGGMDAWREYLQQNLHADVPVKKKAPAGTYQVIVRFIVSNTGKIYNIEAETDHGYGMEKEVIRIIRKGPKWLPAMQDGIPVNAYRRQPVIFMVVEE